MTHKILRTLLAALILLPLGACEKKKDSPEALEAKTYSGREAITVTFNGTEMAGKQGALTPGAGNDASLVMSSEFDLGQLSESLKGMPALKAPGVLPGSPELPLTLNLKPSGSKYSFSGKGETDFVTYNYAGNVSTSALDINFTDVTLKNQTFAGTAWKPLPQSGLATADTQPIRIVWETALPIPIPALEREIQDVLRLLVNVPFIDVYNNTAKMSLTEVIANGLRTLAFDKDGNLPVTYLQTANGASVFTLAPKCTFQYVPLSDASVKVYVNPTDILSLVLLNNTNRDPNIPENPFGMKTRDEMPIELLLANLASMVVPMVADGFPMAAVRQGSEMALFLPTQVLLPLMKNGIVPILQSAEVRSALEQYIRSNPELASEELLIMGVYDAIPLLLDQTTRLEIGLNLTKN